MMALHVSSTIGASLIPLTLHANIVLKIAQSSHTCECRDTGDRKAKMTLTRLREAVNDKIVPGWTASKYDEVTHFLDDFEAALKQV